MAEAHPHQAAGGLQVKVLRGPKLRGACLDLTENDPVTIGYDFENNVVLRDPSMEAQRVRLSVRGGLARLDVLAGEVSAGGESFAAGEVLEVPTFVPFRLGEFDLAIGEAGHPNWFRTEIAVVSPGAIVAEPSGPQAFPAQTRRRRGPWMAMAGLGAAVMLALPWMFAGHPGFASTKTGSAAEIIRASGLKGLSAARTADGAPLIRGYVGSDADLARLQRTALIQDPRAAIEVDTGESLARSADDIFRTHGISAETSVAGERQVAVAVHSGDAATAQAVRGQALHDIPGLRALNLTMAVPPAPKAVEAAPPLTPDPGKTSVAAVGGAQGYIITSDGSRYFKGAVLPGGKRLLDLGQHKITVGTSGGDHTDVSL